MSLKSKKPSVLYATTQLSWPLDNGQKIVSYHDLKALERRLSIDVVSYIDPVNQDKQQEYLSLLQNHLPTVHFLKPIPHQVIRSNWHKYWTYLSGSMNGLPYVVTKYFNKDYLQLIQKLLSEKEYDILYIDHLHPSFILSKLSTGNIRVIYRAHDFYSETLADYKFKAKNPLVRLAVSQDYTRCYEYEKGLWEAVDIILPVTKRLQSFIHQEKPQLASKTLYLPVSVDLSEKSGKDLRIKKDTTGKRVLYIGTVHYPPNLEGLRWFIEKSWPLILAKNPEAQFDIVGRGSEQLAPVPESIHLHGYVEDIEEFYQRADVFIVPLFAGSGIRLKILDSLKRGLPVVSTSAGYQGLDLESGKNILIADSEFAFADHICNIVQDKVLQLELTENGLEYMLTHHNPQMVEKVIDELAF